MAKLKVSLFEPPYSIVRRMDNLEFMRAIPDNYFQLAIVDPPYGINAANMQMGSNPKRSRTEISSDYFDLHHEWFERAISQELIKYTPTFSQENLFELGKEVSHV